MSVNGSRDETGIVDDPAAAAVLAGQRGSWLRGSVGKSYGDIVMTLTIVTYVSDLCMLELASRCQLEVLGGRVVMPSCLPNSLWFESPLPRQGPGAECAAAI